VDFGILIILAVALPVCAFAGFFMALGQRRQSREFALQLAAFGARLQALETRFVAPAPEPPPVGDPTAIEEEAPSAAAPEPAAASEPLPEELPRGEPARAPPFRPAVAPGPRLDLEVALGTRWAVWVGGVALALGGLFLVRYSIEQGLFGPSARVAAGTLFSLVLLAAGEWMRRRETTSSIPGIPSAHVPGVLTAAGTSTAFATVYSAYALYGMLPPSAAFVLLGAVAVLTMLASALHGPGLAALGLVAAFVSPLLVTTTKPNLWALVLYLGFVVLASYGVARLRLWRWLALAGAAGAILWTLPLVLASVPSHVMPLLLHVLLQTSLAGIFLVADPYRGIADREAQPDWFANSVLLAFALLGILVTYGYDSGRPAFAGGLALILLGFAVRYPAASPSALSAAIVTTGALMVWPVAREVAAAPYTVVPDGTSGAPRPEALQAYLAFAVSLPVIIAGASLWRIARVGALSFRPAAWLCAAATLAPLSALVAAYWRVEHLERSISFAIIAGLLGLAFVAVAAWLRRDERDETVRLAVGSTASAAIAAVAAGLTFALEQGMLTVAFALAALGTAWVADRVAIPALRYAVGAIALVVLGRLLWDPAIVRGPAGDSPILNWFLWGYGVPALAFYAASRIMERAGRDHVVRLLESLSILLSALLAFFEIRHWIHGGDVFTASSGHLEMGLLATTGLAFAIVMVRLEARRPDLVYQVASLAFGAASLLIGGFGLGIIHNPLFTSEAVPGGSLINSLLPSYLLPAILAAALAMFARRSRPRWYVLSAAGLALALHLLYSILAIRRAFQGEVINIVQVTGQAELWTYSVALLLIGVVILAIGLIRNIRIARLVSAGYIIAAVFKVFVIDLSTLHGIARALSFIGLGLALVGIGLVYQKLLGARNSQAEG
jgi:uncharacterized membrane protein